MTAFVIIMPKGITRNDKLMCPQLFTGLDMKHKCMFCSKAYIWPADLKRHIRIKHPAEQQLQPGIEGQQCSRKDMKHRCMFCSKAYIWSADLKRHIRIKHPVEQQ